MPISSNHVLAALSGEDIDRLRPHLEECPLVLRALIEKTGQAVSSIYFPLSGIVSVVAGPPGEEVEVGVVGRFEMTGSWSLLGATTAPANSFVQIAGEALRINLVELQRAMNERPGIRHECLLGVASLMRQTAETAWANARSTLAERLARWLLLCHDRIDGDSIYMTHEFLSLMLGVRRPGVTLALQTLEGAGVIKNTRGLVVVRNRVMLEEIAGRFLVRPQR